jgi:hypothetical protein
MKKDSNDYITLASLKEALLRNNSILCEGIKEDTRKIVSKSANELALIIKKRFDEVNRRFDKTLGKITDRL